MSRHASASQADQAAAATPALSLTDGLGLIAHDIRSSLSVVRGFATTLDLLWDRLGEDKIHGVLGMIAARADELVSFADDLLDMSRAEEGRLELSLERVCLRPLLEDAVRHARVDHPGHSFTARMQDGLVVECDRRRVGQVVSNLLDNAARCATPGSTVEVEAKPALGSAVVSVTNSGSGIPADLRPHLFQKFVPSDARRPGGCGLGLYLCRLIIELHRGRIWAEDGGGATSFRFAIPISGGESSV